MPVNRSRAAYDTFIHEANANKNFGDWHLLTLAGDTNDRRFTLLYFAGLPPQGATVSTATLRIWLRTGPTSDWSGTHTITAKRITRGWKESLITWNRAGTAQLTDGTTNPASAVVVNGTGGQMVEIDVSLMMADVAAGADYRGIRLEVDTTGTRRIHSSESATPSFRPQLEVVWNRAPLAPVDLAPSGGRSVSVSNPVLTWNFKDREGDEQAEFQVQIATTDTVDSGGAFPSPEFDTGWVASVEEEFDTSTGVSRSASVTTTNTSTTITAATATFESADVGHSITGTGIPAGTTIATFVSATEVTMSQAATASGTVTATITRTWAGITDGATRYWIVRTKDVPGLVSPWSDPEEFRRDAKGAFTIDSPIDGGTVDETTPPIVTTLTGRAQEALAYQLLVEDPLRGWMTTWEQPRFLAESADGVAHSFNIPKGLIRRPYNYRIRVWSWDTVDREDTPGDSARLTDVATFTFVRSATPSPVTSLTVVEETPGVKLTWNRAALVGQPDFFALMVDGERVFDRIDPLDFSLGGDPIVYEMVWYGATNNVEHTFEVEAVVDDGGTLKHSQGNATVTMTPDLADAEVGGTWLVDDDTQLHPSSTLPRRVRIRGAEVPDLQIGESSATFFPVGRRSPVYIVDAIRGLEGTVSGVVGANDLDDPNSADFLDNFEWAKLPENVGRRWRLVFGDINIPVQLGQATNTHMDSHLRRHQVSIEVSQIAEFPDD